MANGNLFRVLCSHMSNLNFKLIDKEVLGYQIWLTFEHEFDKCRLVFTSLRELNEYIKCASHHKRYC